MLTVELTTLSSESLGVWQSWYFEYIFNMKLVNELMCQTNFCSVKFVDFNFSRNSNAFCTNDWHGDVYQNKSVFFLK